MRLHSNTLTQQDIQNALKTAVASGRVDSRVYFVTLDVRGSRSRASAYEVQLGWYGDKVKGDGRHYKNSGVNGSDSTVYAATYDEWGWFIDELYKLDPNLVFGHYKTRETFDSLTRYAFGD